MGGTDDEDSRRAAPSFSSVRLAQFQASARNPAIAENAPDALKLVRPRLVALAGNDPEFRALFERRVDKVFDEILAELEISRAGEHVPNRRLETIVTRINEALAVFHIAPPTDLAIGALQAGGVNAFSDRYFRETNTIAVHMPLMIFAWLLAKSCAPFTMPLYDPKSGDVQLGPHRALRWLTQLVIAYVEGDPTKAQAYTPPRQWPFWPIAIAFVNGIETFCVAHEYGHLLHDRDDTSDLITAGLLLEGEPCQDGFTSEVVADRFAMAVVLATSVAANDIVEAFGPLVFFWFLSRIESVAQPSFQVTHPRAADRLTRALELVPPEMKRAWQQLLANLEEGWSIAARAAGVVPASLRADIAPV